MVEVLRDKEYRAHITDLTAERPETDKTVNVASLKPHRARSNNLE